MDLATVGLFDGDRCAGDPLPWDSLVLGSDGIIGPAVASFSFFMAVVDDSTFSNDLAAENAATEGSTTGLNVLLAVVVSDETAEENAAIKGSAGSLNWDRFSVDAADENAAIKGSSGGLLWECLSDDIADENAAINGSSGAFRGEDVVVATCAPSHSRVCVLDSDWLSVR